MVDQNAKNDAPGGSRSDDRSLERLNPRTPSQAFFRQRFLTELAYYEADEPYLSVEKCAARCMKLSVLLTAALARSDRP